MRKYIKRYLLFGILSDTVLNNLKYGNADADMIVVMTRRIL